MNVKVVVFKSINFKNLFAAQKKNMYRRYDGMTNLNNLSIVEESSLNVFKNVLL